MVHRITHISHNKGPLLYTTSVLLNRAAHYGFRAILVGYIVNSLDVEEISALTLYGWFTALVIWFEVLGAVLGDLVLGNRKSIIIGVVLQVLGMGIATIPSLEALYAGLFLLILGSGLYRPNLIASFGKQYLDKKELIVPGFILYQLAIMLGSFGGTLIIEFFAGHSGLSIGLLAVGILYLVSLIPVLLVKKSQDGSEGVKPYRLENRTVLIIMFAVLVISIFFALNMLGSLITGDVHYVIDTMPTLGISENIWVAIISIASILIGALLFYLFSRYHSSIYHRLIWGLALGTVAYAILLYEGIVMVLQPFMYYLGVQFTFYLGEMLVVASVYSLVTIKSNPKYLAIIISIIALLSSWISAGIQHLLSDDAISGQRYPIIVGFVLMIFLLAGAVSCKRLERKVHETLS